MCSLAQFVFYSRVVERRNRFGRTIHAADCPFEEMHFLRLPVVHAAEFFARTERIVHRECADAEHFFELVNQCKRVECRSVALVHKCEYRDVPPSADLKQLLRLAFDTFARVNHHHYAVHRSEHAVRVLRKILVTRRVEQVDFVAAVIELQYRRADGNAPFPFKLHPVACCLPLIFSRGH